MLYWYSSYWILIPAIIFSLMAQLKVSSTFNKYSGIRNINNYTAFDVTRKILDSKGLYNVNIECIGGHLTDHYDPSTNTIRLSSEVYNSTSVASIGVAAHEAGHAIQHAEGYAPINIRNSLVPITRIGSSLSMPIVILGMIFAFQPLITVGIFLFSAIVLFQIITLPVEFNASTRALKLLDSYNMLEGNEVAMAGKVLKAAAMTYVAAMLSSVLSLFRLILISRRRK